MFRKLVSNLPFNPSLIGQVSFYAKRMHQEQAVRRMGLAMVGLAMVLQLFAVISPPQATLARVGNDLIPGGAVGRDNLAKQGSLVNHCKANNYDFATILEHFGISCTAIYAGKVRPVNSREFGGQLYSMGRAPYGKTGETTVKIAGLSTLYMRPLWSWDSSGSSTYTAVSGTRANGTPFMILFDCGNLVIVGPPPVAPPEKSLTCHQLDISVPSTTTVPINTTIAVLGRFTGDNLPAGQTVDMNYDFVFVNTGARLGSQETRGVPFSNNVAKDPNNKFFVVSKPGHYQFRLAGIFDGSKLVAGSLQGACVQDVYVATPPPPPEKVIECSNLISSFGNGQKVVVGSNVTVRGQAVGRNLAQDEKVDMYYDYIDNSGKVVESQKTSDITFKDSIAEDKVPRSFKLEEVGTYTFRLAVRSPGSNRDAPGSQIGDCAKKVIVEPPCEEDKTGEDDTKCIILSKKATNDTQNIDNADGTVAQAGDTITYTLATTNTSKNTTVKDYVISENMIDVLQYADIVNLSGGNQDKFGVVSWPAIDIKPKETINKKLIIKIKNPIPQTPVSVSDPGSYDMKLTNIYGNTVNIELPPSIIKTTEYTTKQLPNTGPGETLAAGFLLTAVVGYFFARSRLLAKETDILVNEYAVSGGI